MCQKELILRVIKFAKGEICPKLLLGHCQDEHAKCIHINTCPLLELVKLQENGESGDDTRCPRCGALISCPNCGAGIGT